MLLNITKKDNVISVCHVGIQENNWTPQHIYCRQFYLVFARGTLKICVIGKSNKHVYEVKWLIMSKLILQCILSQAIKYT